MQMKEIYVDRNPQPEASEDIPLWLADEFTQVRIPFCFRWTVLSL
jgi:hypothetical protein